MNKEQFAVYEIEPAHGSIKNGIILGPFATREEAESARLKYGYSGDNYYVDNMNKEKYNQIIDEAHKRYVAEMWFHPEDNWLEELDGMDMSTGERKKVYRQYSQEEFINKCKTDPEFSEEWGLKIEERELSFEERQEICPIWTKDSYGIDGELRSTITIDWDKTPAKLITLTYNNETIESYE
jgi:hypothetical protein